MKKYVSLVVVATMAVGLAGFAVAQDAAKPKVSERVKIRSSEERMMPEPVVHLDRLTQGLQLTQEQQKQIRPILEDEYAKLKQIRQNEDISPKQIQKQIEALRFQTITKVEACLTPDQKKKYQAVSDEIKANKQKRMKENRKERIGTKADPSLQPRQ